MATLTPTLSLSQGEGANLFGSRLVLVILVPHRLGGSARKEPFGMPLGPASLGFKSVSANKINLRLLI
jgi:hypothetical protein